jgi:HTH-type transcriptional regulator / antitoxin HigA
VKSQLEDLEAELRDYETLKSGGAKMLELGSLDGLLKVLIQARFAAGLTQKDLAARLGVRPQQTNATKPTTIRGQASRDCALLGRMFESHPNRRLKS